MLLFVCANGAYLWRTFSLVHIAAFAADPFLRLRFGEYRAVFHILLQRTESLLVPFFNGGYALHQQGDVLKALILRRGGKGGTELAALLRSYRQALI